MNDATVSASWPSWHAALVVDWEVYSRSHAYKFHIGGLRSLSRREDRLERH
jgi:hypothetical protein